MVGGRRGTEIRSVTIARLRRKLGEPDVITTTPGVGHRIADAASPPS
jgi:DNA-binding response OmpR family regulator